MYRIVVDVMGGDHAPEEIIRGAAEASTRLQNSELILVGDALQIGRTLPKLSHDGGRVRVHHAPTAIFMDERPKDALLQKPDASIIVAAELVAQGEGDALVSAGNTGACVMACANAWKRLPGVRRAPLAAVYPTELRRGEKSDPFSLILDVGATVEASGSDLVTFALMGSAYATVISQNPRPRVALLSNGQEAGKGPAAVVEAYERLRDMQGINFIGNIEGIDIPRGVADVVVCSGYVGNVVIKMLEGVSETVANFARYAYKESFSWRAALMVLSRSLRELKQITDWQQYGGAPLLGMDHLFIKAHGRSKAPAIRNAIRVAEKSLRANLNSNIAAHLDAVHKLGISGNATPRAKSQTQDFAEISSTTIPFSRL